MAECSVVAILKLLIWGALQLFSLSESVICISAGSLTILIILLSLELSLMWGEYGTIYHVICSVFTCITQFNPSSSPVDQVLLTDRHTDLE